MRVEGSLIGFKYNDTTYYYIKNMQEDIIGITDESHIGIINPYRYRSYYYDKEIKLYYLNSRYYNPELNIDSISGEIGDIMSHNMYKYANNNPINFGDEDGNIQKWLKNCMRYRWSSFCW